MVDAMHRKVIAMSYDNEKDGPDADDIIRDIFGRDDALAPAEEKPCKKCGKVHGALARKLDAEVTKITNTIQSDGFSPLEGLAVVLKMAQEITQSAPLPALKAQCQEMMLATLLSVADDNMTVERQHADDVVLPFKKPPTIH
jgi:hypothetical protein